MRRDEAAAQLRGELAFLPRQQVGGQRQGSRNRTGFRIVWQQGAIGDHRIDIGAVQLVTQPGEVEQQRPQFLLPLRLLQVPGQVANDVAVVRAGLPAGGARGPVALDQAGVACRQRRGGVMQVIEIQVMNSVAALFVAGEQRTIGELCRDKLGPGLVRHDAGPDPQQGSFRNIRVFPERGTGEEALPGFFGERIDADAQDNGEGALLLVRQP